MNRNELLFQAEYNKAKESVIRLLNDINEKEFDEKKYEMQVYINIIILKINIRQKWISLYRKYFLIFKIKRSYGFIDLDLKKHFIFL